jgi:hypothetical protein
VDKQKEIFRHERAIIGCAGGPNLIRGESEEANGGIRNSQKVDPPTRPKDRPVREALQFLSERNSEVLNLIEKFELEIL